MTTITIPQKLAQKGDLVIVPRQEYEDLLALRQEFTPTAVQRRALRQAEKNLTQGRTLSYHELTRRLGFTD